MKMFITLVFFFLFTACGGEGKLGEDCDTPSGDGECEAGTICTNMSGGENVCRKICTDQAQCAMNENCNGVSGSSTKSCQPS